MSKTIKFNLICDHEPVRTIDDLQNNFSIEDVLEYYNNRLLHRWLEVRGYSEELEKVSGIASTQPLEIIKDLIKIFGVVTDDKKTEESVYILEYLKKRNELHSIYEKANYKIESIIDDYKDGYSQLVNGILASPEDAAVIKANITEIVMNYKWLLELDYRNLFWIFWHESTLAVMCLLMNEVSRDYYIPSKAEQEIEERIIEDKKEIFDEICNYVEGADLKEELGENLISFSGETDGYWKDLEPKGKRYMIISMGKGDFVRAAGKKGGDLSSSDINNKFVILDGIDYKSNSASRQLLYMEV